MKEGIFSRGALVLKEKGRSLHCTLGDPIPMYYISKHHSFSMPLPNLTHAPPQFIFLGSWSVTGHHQQQAEVARSRLSVYKLTRLLTNPPFQHMGSLVALACFRSQ
jgi:hypothetical protein